MESRNGMDASMVLREECSDLLVVDHSQWTTSTMDRSGLLVIFEWKLTCLVLYPQRSWCLY